MTNFFAVGNTLHNIDCMVQVDFKADGTATIYLSDGRTAELTADDAEDLEERLIPAVKVK